jgi:hypothetical protein
MEAEMKKKGARDIPDFSHAHVPARTPAAGAVPGATPGAAPRKSAPMAAASARQGVKPHGTSAKSGRRGQ